MLFAKITGQLTSEACHPYDFVVVDEAQDMGVPELRFLATLGAAHEESLFFAGDLGQRIFQPPFSWKSLGVDVRGRSRTLRVNYRTSHQIRVQADRLLPPQLSDIDGIVEERCGTVSAFDGPDPIVRVFDSQDDELSGAAAWLRERVDNGAAPESIGVFFRSTKELPRARAIADAAKLAVNELDGALEPKAGKASLITMHLAKGLEYGTVLVIACDDEILPLQERVATVSDDSELEEVYTTERHLLYVACTRARDHLMVTGVDPASEFLDDLTMEVS